MFLKLLQGLNSDLEAKIRLDYDVCVCVHCVRIIRMKKIKERYTKKNIDKMNKSIHLENERREFHLIYTESNLRMLNQT